eukprot:c6755_g1_i2.p1 GENE.c6755_g1_i2~~c6755_g1_i2.p1  ORF type:complete len:488 (+),score=125.32 c6755_g1_i2:49-1512(+)
MLLLLFTSLVPSNDKVIVVGAGISGMSAARALANNGYDVTVLEARSRLCGRIWTNTDAFNNFVGPEGEMGASWIHGSTSKHPITQLAKRLKLSTFHTDDEALYVSDGAGHRISDDQSDTFDSLIETAQSNADDRDNDVSLYSEFQRLDGYDAPLMQLWMADLEFNAGGAANLLSAWYFDDDSEYDGEERVVVDGYSNVCSGLHTASTFQEDSADFEVITDAPVKKIKYSSDGATVETSESSYTADKVIVTVPLGILKKGSITFSPALPDSKVSAISRLGFGTVAKLVLEFSSTFWSSSVHYYAIADTDNESSRGMFKYWLNLKGAVQKPMLMTFALGANAYDADDMDDDTMVAAAMENLRKLFPSAPNPTGFARSRWSTDQYAYGAYSFMKTGSTDDDWAAIREPVQDTLFFAGEHTTRDCRGTVHGAYLSGIKAAMDIDGCDLDLDALPHDTSVCEDLACDDSANAVSVVMVLVSAALVAFGMNKW